MRSDLYQGHSNGGAPETGGRTTLLTVIGGMDLPALEARVARDCRLAREAFVAGDADKAVTIAARGLPYAEEIERRLAS